MLTLVPCNHYWLEVYARTTIVAVCKFCKKRGEFTPMEWIVITVDGRGINKPVRIS